MSAPEGVQPTSDARASIARGERRALLSTCVAAAARAAELIRRHAANLEAVTWEVKSQADFVSNADREAETSEGIAPCGRCEEAWLGGLLAPPDGITQQSETVGPYSQSQSYANPMGNVFLTAAERTEEATENATV